MEKDLMTIGTDPEFFLMSKSKDRIISSIPHINGTKYAPQLLPSGGNIQRDNVAVEIATKPAESREDFVAAIKNTIKEAVEVLPEGTQIEAIPSARLHVEELDHEEAMVFGCDPDFDAYDVVVNDPPNVYDDPTFRSCGAHIHVGTNGKDGNNFLLTHEGKLLTVKVMDCLHGIISSYLDSSKESVERRKLYGKPGAHRPKEYGVEYRVLSNYWLKSPVTVMMVYHLTEDALNIIKADKAEKLIDTIGVDEIKRVIMEGDSDAAKKIIDTCLMEYMSVESIEHFNMAHKKLKEEKINLYKEWGITK